MRISKRTAWFGISALDALCWAVIIAGLCMLFGCGGGGSDAAVAAVGLPVNPLAATTQSCAADYTGTYPNCVAPTPPPCGTQGTIDQTCTGPTTPLPPGVPQPACSAGSVLQSGGGCGAPALTGPPCTLPGVLYQALCYVPQPPIACPVGFTLVNGTPAGQSSVPGSWQCDDRDEVTAPLTICSGGSWNEFAAECTAPAVPPVGGGSGPCPVGDTPNATCICPAADMNADNGSCLVPNPACPGYATAQCPVVVTCNAPAMLVNGSCVTPCAALDPTATGNIPNCSCPAGEVWDQGTCVTPTAPCPNGSNTAPNCSCPVGQVYDPASNTCDVPAPDTLECALVSDPTTGNTTVNCQYQSGVPGDSCSVFDGATGTVPAVSGQGNQSGTVSLPNIFSVTQFALQCLQSNGASTTVTP